MKELGIQIHLAVGQSKAFPQFLYKHRILVTHPRFGVIQGRFPFMSSAIQEEVNEDTLEQSVEYLDGLHSMIIPKIVSRPSGQTSTPFHLSESPIQGSSLPDTPSRCSVVTEAVS